MRHGQGIWLSLGAPRAALRSLRAVVGVDLREVEAVQESNTLGMD